MGRSLLTVTAIILAVFALLTILMPERLAAVGTTGALLAFGTAMLAASVGARSLFVSREHGGDAPQSAGEAVRYALLLGAVVVLLIGVFRLFPGLEQWWISRGG